MLIHILTPGGLSWTRNGVPRTDDAHDRLKREKARAKPEDLCRGMPSEFEEFLRYCRRIRFAECPDYEHWREEFRALMSEHGYGESEKFIWPPPPVEVSSDCECTRRPRPHALCDSFARRPNLLRHVVLRLYGTMALRRFSTTSPLSN